MALSDEYKAKALRDGLIKPIFYGCPNCKEIIESTEYTDSCNSCKWQGELYEATTEENMIKLLQMKKQTAMDTKRKIILETLELEEQQEKKDNKEKNSVITRTKDLATIMQSGIPITEWFVENIIPKRGIVVIGAEAGSYKTYLSQHIALTVSQGKKFLEQFSTKKGNVLYIDEENGQILLMKRFAQLADGHEYDTYPNNLYLTIFEGIKLDTPLGVSTIKLLIESYNAELIILDSMVRLMEGDEDKSTEVRLVFDCLKNLMEERQCSFIILHHTRKDGGSGFKSLRGSGDFAAFADVVLMVQRVPEGGFKINMEKNRHLDLTAIQPFRVSVLHPESNPDAIRLEYFGIMEDNQRSIVQECLKTMKELLLKNNVSEFLNRSFQSQIKAKGYSDSSFYRAKEILIQERIIRPDSKRGLWHVEKSLLHVEESLLTFNESKIIESSESGIKFDDGSNITKSYYHQPNPYDSKVESNSPLLESDKKRRIVNWIKKGNKETRTLEELKKTWPDEMINDMINDMIQKGELYQPTPNNIKVNK